MSLSLSISPVTVTELTLRIKYNLEENFESVCLIGEVSNLAIPRSGHAYLNIKDKRSIIAGVMFKSSLQNNKFDLENGQEILFWGRVSVYGARGVYQLIIEKIEPVGIGALQLAFEQLKSRLEKEGLFDESKKKVLPFIPKGIGIVTSATGAAFQDILKVLERRYPSLPLLLNPVLVQGDEAAADIASAIDQFQEFKDEIDLLIVGRGGGSLEDLWPFNEEVVARAIYNSSIPVLSAVGHETDFTIADYVSDQRAATPSVAAELAVPVQEELLASLRLKEKVLVNQYKELLDNRKERLSFFKKRLRSPNWVIQSHQQQSSELTDRLYQNIQLKLFKKKHSLKFSNQQLFNNSPRESISRAQIKLLDLKSKLIQASRQSIESKRQRLNEIAHVMNALSPYAVLKRGYAMVTDIRGKVKNSVLQMGKNDLIKIRFKDGTVTGRVTEVGKSIK